MIKNVVKIKFLFIFGFFALFFVVKNVYANNFNSFNQNVKNYNKKILFFDKSDRKIIEFNVAIADNGKKRTWGLMNLKEMPIENGMLFVFDGVGSVKMWMKNTYIGLDMVFLYKGKVVSIYRGAAPLDLTPIDSRGNVDSVLEVNAGAIKEVEVGDKVILM